MTSDLLVRDMRPVPPILLASAVFVDCMSIYVLVKPARTDYCLNLQSTLRVVDNSFEKMNRARNMSIVTVSRDTVPAS